MDAGALPGLIGGYLAGVFGVFLLYSPVLVLAIGLLLAAGMLQLVARPFIVLIRKLGRKP